MPEYLSPGVYIEEVDSGPRPIEGVGTAMAAFVGFAPSGPANKPELITNWSQYVDRFGALDEAGRKSPHMVNAYLSHAVYGYFLNGGGRCYVTRVVPTNTKADKPAQVQLPSKSSRAIASLTVTTKGQPSSDVQVEVTPPTGPDAPEGTFNVKVKMNDIEETYENVSIGAKKGGKNAAETINQSSRLVSVVEAPSKGVAGDLTPELGNYIIKSSPSTLPVPQSTHFVGDASDRSGLEGLEIAEDVTMVCCPDLMSAYVAGAIDKDSVKAVQLAMIAHCERLGDRMAILDPLPDLLPQAAKKWREVDTNYDSKFAVAYYPWLVVDNPLKGDNQPNKISVPPCGHIAGVWARNDNERGVHKAPANEVVRGVLEVATPITKGEQDVLNPIGVNCIRTFTGRGLRVWGARTLSSDPAWRYVNVRRLFNYVEQSLERGMQWVVFEPNDQNLWAKVRRDARAFLTVCWRDGMLFGLTPDEAFYVKCDEELNPQEIRDQGKLVIEIGMSPVKPAEFVIFRFSQWAGGGS